LLPKTPKTPNKRVRNYNLRDYIKVDGKLSS